VRANFIRIEGEEGPLMLIGSIENHLSNGLPVGFNSEILTSTKPILFKVIFFFQKNT